MMQAKIQHESLNSPYGSRAVIAAIDSRAACG